MFGFVRVRVPLAKLHLVDFQGLEPRCRQMKYLFEAAFHFDNSLKSNIKQGSRADAVQMALEQIACIKGCFSETFRVI